MYTEAPQGQDRQTGSAARSPQAELSILDTLHCAVIVTDARGAPLFCNAAANTMLLQGDPIAIAAGCLLLRSGAAQAAIDGYFERAASAPAPAPDTLVLRVARRDGRPTCRLLLMRLQDRFDPTGSASSLFAISIYEPHAGRCIPVRVLTELYGLSPAEARLTAELFKGHALEDAGAQLGIAVSTARTHLKRVFAKCEVRSQAELLQLLALGPRTI